MTHRVRTAVGTALATSLIVAAVLTVMLTTPSQATPDGRLDAAAVSAAFGDATLTLFPAAAPGTPPPDTADGVGAFDPTTATWHLRTRAGDPTVFAFGTPGSQPLIGDWDGDGIETVGAYDPATATVSFRNTNSAGEPDSTFLLGATGDVAIAGDFDGDGTDTVAVYRPSDGFVRVFNSTGADLGEPAATYTPAAVDGPLSPQTSTGTARTPSLHGTRPRAPSRSARRPVPSIPSSRSTHPATGSSPVTGPETASRLRDRSIRRRRPFTSDTRTAMAGPTSPTRGVRRHGSPLPVRSGTSLRPSP